MTELRQRMIDAMVQRGLAQRTQDSYVDAIYRMAKFYRRDPAGYSASEVQTYLLHLVKERHLSYSTVNQAACLQNIREARHWMTPRRAAGAHHEVSGAYLGA